MAKEHGTRTLILIDPSDPHGDSGIDELTPSDEAVSLLLILDRKSTAALREFAASEEIDVSMAGLIYLDQMVSRASLHAVDIETISTSHADAVGEIFHVLEQRRVNRVIVPASLPGLAHGGLARLVSLCPVPVVVRPAAPTGQAA